jgi:hypothetical protein
MNENDDCKKHKCDFCNYKTNRKFDLKKHQNRMHKCQIIEITSENLTEKNVPPNRKNVPPNRKNVPPNRKIVPPNRKNVPLNQNMCKKCNKIYKTKNSLIEHEKKCTGVDDLTCPRCMISFTTRQHKFRHIKKNNCEARSIIHARTPNAQNNITNNNIETQNNIENQNNITNNTTNNIDNTINNTIININNYGKERLDYLTFDKMFTIFKNSNNIPTLLAKEIHFNDNFPENNNIKYENVKTALIKKDDKFIYKNINNLVKQIINDKGHLMQKFALENKDKICLSMELDRYQELVQELLTLVLLKEPLEFYKEQIENIKDLIKNNNIEKSTFHKKL